MKLNSSQNGSSFLEIKNIEFSYPSTNVAEPLSILKNITLSVEKGQSVGILGPSGCGKTTLLCLMSGLLSPSKGEILIGGNSPDDTRRDQQIGFAFQAPNLLPWRTALENVRLPLELTGSSQTHEKALASLTLVNLKKFQDYYPHQLSGGMQTRVNLARALVMEPALLLLDEPLGQLDEPTRLQLMMDIQRIRLDTNITMVMVTHSIEESIFLNDHVLLMKHAPTDISSHWEIDLEYPRNSAVLTTKSVRTLLINIRKHMSNSFAKSGQESG